MFPLLAACEGGHYRVAKALLEKKANVNRASSDLRTPLCARSERLCSFCSIC